MNTKEGKRENELGNWAWHMYTTDAMILHIKLITNENDCVAQETPLNALWYSHGRTSKTGTYWVG